MRGLPGVQSRWRATSASPRGFLRVITARVDPVCADRSATVSPRRSIIIATVAMSAAARAHAFAPSAKRRASISSSICGGYTSNSAYCGSAASRTRSWMRMPAPRRTGAGSDRCPYLLTPRRVRRGNTRVNHRDRPVEAVSRCPAALPLRASANCVGLPYSQAMPSLSRSSSDL